MVLSVWRMLGSLAGGRGAVSQPDIFERIRLVRKPPAAFVQAMRAAAAEALAKAEVAVEEAEARHQQELQAAQAAAAAAVADLEARLADSRRFGEEASRAVAEWRVKADEANAAAVASRRKMEEAQRQAAEAQRQLSDAAKSTGDVSMLAEARAAAVAEAQAAEAEAKRLAEERSAVAAELQGKLEAALGELSGLAAVMGATQVRVAPRRHIRRHMRCRMPATPERGLVLAAESFSVGLGVMCRDHFSLKRLRCVLLLRHIAGDARGGDEGGGGSCHAAVPGTPGARGSRRCLDTCVAAAALPPPVAFQ